MNPCSLRSILAVGALALVLSTPAFAGPGAVTLSWNTCGPIPVTDVTVTPGQSTGLNLTASVLGQSDATQSYQVKVIYGNAQKLVPDAWRFDPNGCQGSALVTLDHLPPAALSKACPAFQNAGGTNVSLQIKNIDFSPATLPYPTTMMLVQVAVAYPSGNVPVAAQRYFLMGAEFTQLYGTNGPTNQVQCGGLEQPICFSLVSATYIINDGTLNELPFQTTASGSFVTANGFGGGCLSVPARPRTWGSVKSQYRL